MSRVSSRLYRVSPDRVNAKLDKLIEAVEAMSKALPRDPEALDDRTLWHARADSFLTEARELRVLVEVG